VAYKNVYVGLPAAEALVGIRAEESSEWARVRNVLSRLIS